MKTERGFTSVTGPCGDLIKMGLEFSFPWSDFYQEIAANALCKRNEESQKSILAEDITDCITTGKEFMHDKKNN